MIGWRARLGFILPSINVVLEQETTKILAPGISGHFARARTSDDTYDELIRMGKEAPKAAEELADAEVDAIAFTCTAASFLEGPDYNREIENRIQEITGIPAITTSSAIVRAQHALGLKKVVLISPYEEWLNERAKVFLEAQGIEVLAMEGLGVIDVHIADVHPEEVYKLARTLLLNNKEADGIFISCTDLRSAEILDVLESDVGKPVLSSNQATIWAMLQTIGLKVPIEGFGSLLRDHL